MRRAVCWQDGAGNRRGHGNWQRHRQRARGAHVAVNHDHTPQSAEKVVVGIQAAGGSAMAVAGGVSSRAEYQAMMEQVLAP